MDALIAFWSHALAAAVFASLLLFEVRRGLLVDGQRLLLAALGFTAVWAWLTAVAPQSVLAAYAETARNLSWVGVLYRLSQSDSDNSKWRGVAPVYGAVAGVLGLQLMVDALPLFIDAGGLSDRNALVTTAIILRLAAAAGALVLVHNLYGQAAPANRARLRPAMFGLALLWAYDLNLYTIGYLDLRSAHDLFQWRGLAAIGAAVLLAAGGDWRQGGRIRLSRAATFQSLSVLGIAGYVGVMAILATALGPAGIDWGRSASIALLAALTAATLLVTTSRRFRGWAKVKIVKHLFEHRYDYRTEWLRFTETLATGDASGGPLGERVIRAFADILDSPSGMLLVRDETGALDSAAAWNWPGSPLLAAASASGEVGAFWEALETRARVIDFETLRSGYADDIDLDLPIPFALVSEPRAWAGIPLIHEGRLTGLVLLGAPDYRRPLDWEDFDLLRTAGRQAASSLAEAHGQQALMSAQRFEEFNRRFAFILHDIKNLVSQLSLIARNAERHAGNPEFQADMVATLKSSVGKMNDLLARIAPKAGAQKVEPQPLELRPRLAAAIAHGRRDHPVELLGPAGAWVMGDADNLEQAVTHLVRNAVEASPPSEPVSVRVEPEDGSVHIVIADKGVGMDSDFIRGRLFQPFASTKDGGFGVGAFEARSLVAAMGGRLTVESTPGEGSRFTIHLPAAPAAANEKKSA